MHGGSYEGSLLTTQPKPLGSSSRLGSRQRLGSSNRLGSSQDFTVSPYGAMRRTCSSASFGGSSVSDFSAMSRQGSFVDLPMVAIPGLATRVSIRGTTAASQDDLPGLFSAQQDDEVDFDEMAFEGGWTWALFLSATAALLSALQFGYNNANMNTPAAVMRAALSVPERTPESCNPSLPLPGNDTLWGFCVSVFCLSALIGAAEGGRLADRWGRRVFLLLNSFIYVIAGALEAAASLPSCESADPCNPEPCIAGLSILMAGRVVTGIACGASTVVVPMYLGEIAPPHMRGQLGSAFLLTAVTAMLLAQATPPAPPPSPHLTAPPPSPLSPHLAPHLAPHLVSRIAFRPRRRTPPTPPCPSSAHRRVALAGARSPKRVRHHTRLAMAARRRRAACRGPIGAAALLARVASLASGLRRLRQGAD